MKKLKYIFLKLFSPKKIHSKPIASTPIGTMPFYNFKFKSLEGKEIDFSIYKGKKVLIVNTASECGYTPQYEELQTLHETHGDKVTILGFPSNNFGGQEPGSNFEIGAFCRKNYGVTFQLFEKIDIPKNSLYKWLSDKNQNGWNDQAPTWNFWKYLINENGQLINYFSSAVSPLSKEVLDKL